MNPIVMSGHAAAWAEARTGGSSIAVASPAAEPRIPMPSPTARASCMETAPGPALSDTDLARVIGGLNRACSDPHCLPAAAPMADRLWPAVSIDSNVGPVPADQRAA